MDPSQQAQHPPDSLIGQTIGNYLVTQKLGEGGMGAVYLAEHPTIGKKVALKVLHSEYATNQEVTARFFNEAKAVNDIGHPNIVDIHDFGILQQPGREPLVYFIMEYLTGRTLSQLIRAEAPMPPERALTIALQVADALAASHKCGIVHRDLKPDNIMLSQRGREQDQVKLLDFGIAKLTGEAAKGSHRTRTGLVMGTPAYMSPEQCEGRGAVDHRTDVYALGIVLYEMLVGRVPFIGEGYGDVLIQHLTQRPLPPSQYRMMPAHVEMVVMKALEKRIEMRYPTMDEMMRAMADPVGYVEAHGGVPNFLQMQLMPSSAPLPPIRLTPPPLTSVISTPTPGPGTLQHPSGIYTPGQGIAMSTPPPTTLGGANGQVAAPHKSSKLVFVIAGVLVVAAAAVGVVLVMNNGKTEASPAATPDPKKSGPDPLQTPPPPKADDINVTITTTPDGAEIFVDNVDQNVKTPKPFKLPRNKKSAIITLKHDGYLPNQHEIGIGDKDIQEDIVLTAKEEPKPDGSNTPPTDGSNGSAQQHTVPLDNHPKPPPDNHHKPPPPPDNHHKPPPPPDNHSKPPPTNGSNTQQQSTNPHDRDGVVKPGDI